MVLRARRFSGRGAKGGDRTAGPFLRSRGSLSDVTEKESGHVPRAGCYWLLPSVIPRVGAPQTGPRNRRKTIHFGRGTEIHFQEGRRAGTGNGCEHKKWREHFDYVTDLLSRNEAMTDRFSDSSHPLSETGQVPVTSLGYRSPWPDIHLKRVQLVT